MLGFKTTTTLAVAATGKSYALQLRSPSYPLWWSKPYATYTGSMYFRTADISSAAKTIPFLNGESMDLTSLTRDAISVTSSDDLTGLTYPRGCDANGNVWFYCPHLFKPALQLVCAGSVTAGAWNITCEVVYDMNLAETENVIIAATASSNGLMGTGSSMSGCWYRPVEITCTTNGAGSRDLKWLRVGCTTNGSVSYPTAASVGPFFYPVVGPAEYSSSTKPYASVRATSVGTLFTNVTALFNQEGTAECGVLVAASTNVFQPDAAAAAISGLLPNMRYFGPLQKGLYSFVLPDAQSDQFMSVSSTNPDGTISLPAFHLDAFARVNILVFSDLSGYESSLAVTHDTHIEFRNTSQLFPVGMSHVALETWHQSQLALLGIGCFHENPLHLAEIAKMARSLASVASPYVMPVAKAAGAAAIKAVVSRVRAAVAPAPRTSQPNRQKARPKAPAKKKRVAGRRA